MNSAFKIKLLMLVLCVSFETRASEPNSITDYLQEKSGGKVKLVQPKELSERIERKNSVEVDTIVSEEKQKVVGYRVQVFSDNNQRTAKAQAEARQRNVSVQFPNWSVYRLYKSPLWRVRVGDFKTRGEAEFAMHELKKAFPSYASEMMVVVDNINVTKK